jgi:hypothetical protein
MSAEPGGFQGRPLLLENVWKIWRVGTAATLIRTARGTIISSAGCQRLERMEQLALLEPFAK